VATGEHGIIVEMTPCALDFHKPSKFFLLEVRPNSEVVMSRTHAARKTVIMIIDDLLRTRRHGQDRGGQAVMEGTRTEK